MTKLLIVLLIGLCFEAAGVVGLSRGLKQIGEVQKVTVPEVWRIFKKGVTNPSILFGTFLETIFFGCLLYLMSQGTVSFVWPLTALGFVLTTFAAKFYLHEQVSLLRWSGVLLIVFGAGLITYSEKILEAKPPASTPIQSAPSANP
jgi:drug/metabolite transporter (DMT)-like permease